MRTNRRRNYDKPQWEIDKENAEREKREAIQRGLEQTEENFPRLGTGQSKTINWSGRKFVELASEWKADDDARKAVEELSASASSTNADVFVMPKFTLTHHYTEEDVIEDDDAPPPVQDSVSEEDAGWVTVDNRAKYRQRMIRKEVRIEEKLRRLDNGEDVEPEDDGEDETVEDDTCWNTGVEVAPAGKGHDS